MMVSTRGRYALRVMIDLTQQKSASCVPLRDIADRQEISEKYLESIVKSLTQAGFLEGMRGKKGGYRMTKPADEYSVRSILEAVEGSLAPVACVECEAQECKRAAECPTLPMWTKLNQIIQDYLEQITIQDLAENRLGEPF